MISFFIYLKKNEEYITCPLSLLSCPKGFGGRNEDKVNNKMTPRVVVVYRNMTKPKSSYTIWWIKIHCMYTQKKNSNFWGEVRFSFFLKYINFSIYIYVYQYMHTLAFFCTNNIGKSMYVTSSGMGAIKCPQLFVFIYFLKYFD